jgi:hypothetical protein
LFSFSFFHFVVRAALSGLPTTSRRLGEVAFLKTVQRDDFSLGSVSAETSAIAPNR